MNQRRTVYFSGQVQGVGFRATAQRMAAGTSLTGWVRNLTDGRVELLVEGAPALVDRLVEGLRERFEITDLESNTGAATGEFASFELRY